MKSRRPLAPASGQNPASLAGSLRAPGEPVVGPVVPTGKELSFYLRDIHRYWSTPQISPAQIESLERLNLIQCAPAGLGAIRLTEHGVLVKSGGKSFPRRVTPHSERRADA